MFISDNVLVARVIDTPTADYDKAWMTNIELKVTRRGTLVFVSDMESMKTEMKNETRWNGTRILD